MSQYFDGEASGGGGAVDSVNGQTGVVVLTKSSVGLGNVDNTKAHPSHIVIQALQLVANSLRGNN